MKKGAMSIILVLSGAVIGALVTMKALIKKIDKLKETSDKHFTLMYLLNEWLKTKQEGKTIIQYLHENQITDVAIYGMSYVGKRLYDELKNSDIEIKYAIDRNADGICAEIEVFSLEENLPEAKAVIVTPVFYFDEIKEKLEKKVNSKILSLEDILYEI